VEQPQESCIDIVQPSPGAQEGDPDDIGIVQAMQQCVALPQAVFQGLAFNDADHIGKQAAHRIGLRRGAEVQFIRKVGWKGLESAFISSGNPSGLIRFRVPGESDRRGSLLTWILSRHRQTWRIHLGQAGVRTVVGWRGFGRPSACIQQHHRRAWKALVHGGIAAAVHLVDSAVLPLQEAVRD
jgi:hypothetical protein